MKIKIAAGQVKLSSNEDYMGEKVYYPPMLQKLILR